MAKKVKSRPPSSAVHPAAASPQEQQKKYLGLIAGVALLAWAIYKFSSPVVFLSPTEDRLKDVFFGREPWLVLCDTNGTVDSVFEAVSRRDKGVKFGVLDCAAQLPSKKSTFERLKLNQNAGNPVLFFSGFGRDPRQLPTKLLRNQYVLRKEITALTKLKAAKVKSSTELYKKCLKKGKCGLVLAGGPLEGVALKAMDRANADFPSMNWVILDSTKLKLRKPSEKDIGLRKYQGPGSHRLIVFGDSKGSDGEAVPMLDAHPFLGPFTEEAVVNFVANFSAFGSTKVDPEGLSVMKRKPPQPTYRAPVSAPTTRDPEATILPTAQQEENRKLAAARRAQREAERRAQMDAEAEGFIEYDGEEEDEDDDEEEEEADDEDYDDTNDVLELD